MNDMSRDYGTRSTFVSLHEVSYQFGLEATDVAEIEVPHPTRCGLYTPQNCVKSMYMSTWQL